MSSKEASRFCAVFVAGISLLCGCDGERTSSPSWAAKAVQAALSPSKPAVAWLAQKIAPGETLVAAVKMSHTLTAKSYYEGKFLSGVDGRIHGRAYDLAGNPVDVDQARAAELAARRSLRGAWSAKDHQALGAMAANKEVTAALWVPFLRPPTASVAAVVASAKAPVKTAIAKLGIKELYNDGASPVMVVKGPAAAVQPLGLEPAVGHAWIVTGVTSGALGVPGDAQEKVNMGFSYMPWYFGEVTNDVHILQWDVALPGRAVTEHYQHPSDRKLDRMAYIPFDMSHSLSTLTQDECIYSACTPDTCYDPACSHVERSLGIIAGRRDSQFSPARGFDAFLPQLSSIAVATVSDVVGSDPVPALQRIFAAAYMSPRFDVQSWSGWIGDMPMLDGTPNIFQLYVDYWSVERPTLNVFGAGNEGEFSNHYVTFKQRNGIVVGGYNDNTWVPPEPPNNKMYTHTVSGEGYIDMYSSWLSPYRGDLDRRDRRLPHVSAVGTWVQSFDEYWRDGWKCMSWQDSYQRCDKPNDQPWIRYGSDCNMTASAATGTSFAAPQVAALAAYAMREAKCIHPKDSLLAVEDARAMIIASATMPVTVRSLGGQDAVWPLITGNARYDERRWAAGAGGVAADSLAWMMDAKCTSEGVNPSANHGGIKVYFDPDEPPPVQKTRVNTGSGVDIRCRAAIAWNPLPSCSGIPGVYPVECNEGQGFDFDLCIVDKDSGQVMGCAASWENNYEYLNVPCQANRRYELQIYPFWGTPHQTARVGWAFWWTST